MRHWQVEISEYISGSVSDWCDGDRFDPYIVLAVDQPDADLIKRVFGIVGSVSVNVRELKPIQTLGGHQVLSLDTYNGYGVQFDMIEED